MPNFARGWRVDRHPVAGGGPGSTRGVPPAAVRRLQRRHRPAAGAIGRSASDRAAVRTTAAWSASIHISQRPDAETRSDRNRYGRRPPNSVWRRCATPPRTDAIRRRGQPIASSISGKGRGLSGEEARPPSSSRMNGLQRSWNRAISSGSVIALCGACSACAAAALPTAPRRRRLSAMRRPSAARRRRRAPGRHPAAPRPRCSAGPRRAHPGRRGAGRSPPDPVDRRR